MAKEQFLRRLTPRVLSKGWEVAHAASTEAGRSPGGWIRLARVKGLEEEPYVIAIRPAGKGFQFGCSCKDWIYRRRHTRTMCKHQRQFLTLAVSEPRRFWFYRAGHAFVSAVAVELGLAFKGRSNERGK